MTPDSWLGERLGKPAWHLDAGAAPDGWCAALVGPAFVDTRVAVSDAGRVTALSAAGFRLIDTAVTLDRPGAVSMAADISGARIARDEDADAVAAVARTNFSTDRFHADPDIPDDIADRIKADWARNFFAGQRGDWMVVGETGGRVSGFLQLLDRDGHLVIDLIAVDTAARRQGLAAAMIGHAAAMLMPDAPMRVGTQLANTASIRLYESLGFRMARAEHILHCHAD